MEPNPQIYFYKDGGVYVLMHTGERVGEVKTRKEARKWWDLEQRKEVLWVRGVCRAARGRYCAMIQHGTVS